MQAAKARVKKSPQEANHLDAEVTPDASFAITSVTRRPRKRLYDVGLENGDVLTLSPDVLAMAGVVCGHRFSTADIDQLRTAESRHSALISALRFLSHRPRSEAEVVTALQRRRVAAAIIDEVVTRLKQNGLLDDEAFARNYVEVRDRVSPRSRRILQAELAAHGVSREIASSAPAVIVDEADAAYRAGFRKARAVAGLTFEAFERKLGDHLLRRGFSYDVVRDAVRRLWSEIRPAEDRQA
jgi:regulatory protein